MHPGYTPPLASWVNVRVNGQLLGVYTNVEQPDKTFLRNRNLWVPNQSWLYKQGEIGPPEVEAGSGNSPTFTALSYQPFQASPAPPAGYVTQVQSLIDMDQMLTVGAVNAFTANFDELLTKGKNFWFADFDGGASGGKRLYFPWDLDAGTRRENRQQHLPRPQQYAFRVPAVHYRKPGVPRQYNQIMLDLLNGPLAVAPTLEFLDQLEASLTPSLLADQYNGFGNTPADVAGEFDRIRGWMTARHANVLQQVQADMLAAVVGSVCSRTFTRGAVGRRRRRSCRLPWPWTAQQRRGAAWAVTDRADDSAPQTIPCCRLPTYRTVPCLSPDSADALPRIARRSCSG